MTETKEAKPAPTPPPEPQGAHRRDRAHVHASARRSSSTRRPAARWCCATTTATARDSDGKRQGDKPRATLFFTAYTLKGVRKPEKRPVIFSFNGGPGSSSVWLHLGILGPHRVATDEMGNSPPPPYALVDNEHTLLAESDLVFIDPVGTGHSRMVEGEKVAEFHEYQRDLDAVGEFIRLYLARYGRWGSPKYLIGESYGTTRAAGLSLHLQEKHDIFLNGIMLVSLAVDLQTLSFDPGNELPYPLFLPTYAATAWYHKALAPDLQKKSLREVIAAGRGLCERRIQRGAAAGIAAAAGEAQAHRAAGGALFRAVGRIRRAVRSSPERMAILQGAPARTAAGPSVASTRAFSDWTATTPAKSRTTIRR